jgi:hypothetical protein
MLSFLLGLPSILAGLFSTINGITAAISNERIAAMTAKTDQERVAAEERVHTLQQRRDVMIAESAQSNLNVYVRSCIALGPGSYILKIFLWDKVIGSLVGCSGPTAAGTCGLFITDRLDANLWVVVQVVLGFYFLYEFGTGITRIFKA